MTVESIDRPFSPYGEVYSEEESAATQLHTNAFVAIHGQSILENYILPEGRAAITYSEMVDSLSQAIEPYDLNQSVGVDWWRDVR